jgi:hypothetical protein
MARGHGLLPQPYGFERLVMVEIDPDRHDSPVTDLAHSTAGLDRRRAAECSTHVNGPERDDGIASFDESSTSNRNSS